MEDFVNFDEQMLLEIGLTKQESEIIYLIHPNFQGMEMWAAAELMGLTRMGMWKKIQKIKEKFPMFSETLEKGIKERQYFRENLRNARRLGELEDVSSSDDIDDEDTLFGEKVVRIF